MDWQRTFIPIHAQLFENNMQSYRWEHSGIAFFRRLSASWNKVRVVPTVARDNFADTH